MRPLNIYDVKWAARESKCGPRFSFDIKLDGLKIYASPEWRKASEMKEEQNGKN